jgi:hypothetical protein
MDAERGVSQIPARPLLFPIIKRFPNISTSRSPFGVARQGSLPTMSGARQVSGSSRQAECAYALERDFRLKRV